VVTISNQARQPPQFPPKTTTEAILVKPKRTPKRTLRKRKKMPEPTWTIRPATEADMEYIAQRLSKATIAEMKAVCDCQPLTLLLAELPRKGVIVDKANDKAPVAYVEIRPLADMFPEPLSTALKDAKVDLAAFSKSKDAMFVCAFTEELLGNEWAWTCLAYAHALADQFLDTYPNLFTYVAVDNVRHRIWVERSGWEMVEEIPEYGVGQKPFRRYIKSKAARNV
jgi:hypothetical protein